MFTRNDPSTRNDLTTDTAVTDAKPRVRGGRLTMPRSRGAASGLLLIILGVYGAVIPFLGPAFDFAYSPGSDWTAGRGWLQVLPGVVAALGGALLLVSRNRATAMLGGWLAVAAGAWFVIGRLLAGPLGLGDVGSPSATTEGRRVALELAYFDGLGVLIVLLGALALGRITVRSVRDVEILQRPVAAPATAAPVATTGPVATGAATTGPVTTGPVNAAPVDAEPRRRGGWRNWGPNRNRPLVHR